MAASPPPGYQSPFNASALGLTFWFLLSTLFFYGLMIWMIYPFLYDAPLAYFIDLETQWRRSLYGAGLDRWVRTYGDALYDALMLRTGVEGAFLSMADVRPGLGMDQLEPSTHRWLRVSIDNTLDWMLLISFRIVMLLAWAPLGVLTTTALVMDSLYVLRRRLYEFGDGSVVSSVWARRSIDGIPAVTFILLTIPIPIPSLMWPMIWIFGMTVVTVFVRNTPKRL